MKRNYIKVTTNCLRMNKSHNNYSNINMECQSTKATTHAVRKKQRKRQGASGTERSLSELALYCVLLSRSTAISLCWLSQRNTTRFPFVLMTPLLSLPPPRSSNPSLFHAFVPEKLGQPLNPLR